MFRWCFDSSFGSHQKMLSAAVSPLPRDACQVKASQDETRQDKTRQTAGVPKSSRLQLPTLPSGPLTAPSEGLPCLSLHLGAGGKTTAGGWARNIRPSRTYIDERRQSAYMYVCMYVCMSEGPLGHHVREPTAERTAERGRRMLARWPPHPGKHDSSAEEEQRGTLQNAASVLMPCVAARPSPP